MKKNNEEEVRNNNIEDGEAIDAKITAVYKAEDADDDAEVAEEESDDEDEAEDEADEIDKEDAKEARKILKEKGLVKFAEEVCSSIPKSNKGISGKKLYEAYTKWIAETFATLITVFKVWLNSNKALSEKQVIKMQSILEKIAQNAQNTTLGIISGFRFQTNLNIFKLGWNWLCSKFAWGWMHMIDEFTIFKKSEAPYNNEEINNNLDEYNCKIYDFIIIWNQQYPEYKVNINKQDKIDKFDPATFNNLIWFFNEEADEEKEIVCFTRKFYTNFAKKIDTYCFCKGVKVASIVFGCVVIAGVSYCIYSFGWDGFVNKISEILNTKSESTEETKDELFNTEEVEYLY